MNKIFFLTYPFNERDSGDYDYCSVMVDAINKSDTFTVAQYLTAEILGLDPLSLDEVIGTKNIGGSSFKDSMNKYFEENHQRSENVRKIIEFIAKDSAPQKVLNIQMRPPESGFIFTPKEIEEIKALGVKVSITCHEYKLNYARRWLQEIMHPYFEAADKVFFFNEKDLSNANKHASRSVFIDDILDRGDVEVSDSLLHTFGSKSQQLIKIDRGGRQDLYLAKPTKVQQLSCKAIAGEVKYDEKASPFRYEVDNKKVSVAASSSFTLEWGLIGSLSIPKVETKSFKVSGVVIGSLIDSTDITGNIGEVLFAFEHGAYDLRAKACLTKVPATIPKANSEASSSRPPNIITFGIIRENKGFEEALDFVKTSSIDQCLSKSRLIIAGKCDSYKILAEILNAQYNIKLDEVLLEEISDGRIVDCVSKLREFKDRKIKEIYEAISKCVPCQRELAVSVFEDSLEQHHSKTFVTIEREEPISRLQEFISLLAANFPEVLPIDIFLDVSTNSLSKLFNNAKYAIKFDEKGWANNASSLINSLYFGCILYTAWGMCTDNEVTKGEYSGAIVLPKGKYALKQGEHLSQVEEVEDKKKCYKTSGKKDKEVKKFFVSSQSIIDDIKFREGLVEVPEGEEWDSASPMLSNRSNTKSLEKALLLLASFEANKIALSMIDVFEKLLPYSVSDYAEPYMANNYLGLDYNLGEEL